MPRGDGTGPLGMGTMSGRGAGFCGGFGAPGFMNGRGGRGGFGRGRGMGRGFGYPATPYAAPSDYPPSSRDAVGALREQAQWFGQALENINKRIAELEDEQK